MPAAEHTLTSCLVAHRQGQHGACLEQAGHSDQAPSIGPIKTTLARSSSSSTEATQPLTRGQTPRSLGSSTPHWDVKGSRQCICTASQVPFHRAGRSSLWLPRGWECPQRQRTALGGWHGWGWALWIGKDHESRGTHWEH